MLRSRIIPSNNFSNCSARLTLLTDLCVSRRAKAALNPPSPTVEKPAEPAGPKNDYTLKEGQTFSISIPGREKKPTSGTNLLGAGSGSSGPSSGGVPLLPPPPSAPKRRA